MKKLIPDIQFKKMGAPFIGISFGGEKDCWGLEIIVYKAAVDITWGHK